MQHYILKPDNLKKANESDTSIWQVYSKHLKQTPLHYLYLVDEKNEELWALDCIKAKGFLPTRKEVNVTNRTTEQDILLQLGYAKPNAQGIGRPKNDEWSKIAENIRERLEKNIDIDKKKKCYYRIIDKDGKINPKQYKNLNKLAKENGLKYISLYSIMQKHNRAKLRSGHTILREYI